MKYTEVKIYTSQEGIDPLTCVLMDMGIAGFAIEDARDYQDLMNKKNDYDWDYIDDSLMELEHVRTSVTFYLEENETNRSLLEQLREKYELVWRPVDDSEWKDNWKEYFKPTKITDKIVIKPTWEAYENKENELVIEIDPGMAFGTGTHPTTSLCVKLLEKYIEPGKDAVLDVGCGSGILSIASALLGAKDVLAVDIDPVAVEVSKENVNLNHLFEKISVIEGDLTKGLQFRADVVAANLMADLVMMLSKDVAAHLKGKSIYISSGILIEKQAEVVAAIEACGFHILDIMEEGEWCAIAAKTERQYSE